MTGRKRRVLSNRETLDVWVATFDAGASERLAVQVRLAQELADWLDLGEWSAPDAREYRVTVDALRAGLAEEGDSSGEGAVLLSMSAAIRDTA